MPSASDNVYRRGGRGIAVVSAAGRLRACRRSPAVVAALGASVALLLAASPARAAPGDLTFTSCVGDLAGCATTSPATVLDFAQGVEVSPDGKQLYVAAGGRLSHFTIDAAGDLTFAGCFGSLSGCTPPAVSGALDQAANVSVSANETQLYVAGGGSVVSHFSLDGAGNPTFADCVGHISGCVAPTPSGALDGYIALAQDATDLYASASLAAVVSHYAIGAGGGLTFAGCIGDTTGCTPTAPANVLDRVSGVTLTPDAKHLYAAAFASNAVTHFTIDTMGNLTFAGCTGNDTGCTATVPTTALQGAARAAVSPDAKHLYVTAGTPAPTGDVSHLTLDAGGNLTFAGCIGDSSGCTTTSPAAALDEAFGVVVTPDGKQLYAAGTAVPTSAVSRFTLDGSGNLAFAACTGQLSGCTQTRPTGALSGVQDLAVTPDGNQLYAASFFGNTVSHFMRGCPVNAAACPPAPICPVSVAACPPLPGCPAACPPAPVAPAISVAQIVPAVFPADARGASLTARRRKRRTGTTVSYRDSQAATTTFTVSDSVLGHRQGKRCRPGRPRKHQRRCARQVTLGAFTHADRAGSVKVHFSGRVRGRKLRPGRYTLVLTPRASALAGASVSLRLRIVK